MSETSESKRGWRIARRVMVGLAVLATLLAVFYTEEDWRGQRAWGNYKHDLEAQGLVFDWNAYIPPPVPDDQNFFKATNMTAWFVKGPGNLVFTNALYNSNTVATLATKEAARDFLAWSDQFQPRFDQIHEALKRPYARLDTDYTQPSFQVQSFVSIRILVQVLAQRAKCDLLLQRPEAAVGELALLNDSRRMLASAPTGKPITLLAAMINVAVAGLYVDTIASSLRQHAWQEPQLAALQEQLASVKLAPMVCESLHENPVWASYLFETLPPRRFLSELEVPRYMRLFPRGWGYQNLINFVRLCEEPLDGFDLANDIISPEPFERMVRDAAQHQAHSFPFNIFVDNFLPNFSRAVQTTAHNQTRINEAQIACALERYYLAHGKYPTALDVLVPQFIGKIPQDIMGGKALKYHRTADGKFLLYSIGWNEIDDGGQPSTTNPTGGVDYYDRGDWVWE